MNHVFCPYMGSHTLWHHKIARQVKDSYTLLIRTLRSHNQRFAVHGILYTILPLKISKNTEKVGVFCVKIPRFPSVIVVVEAKPDNLPSRQPQHCVILQHPLIYTDITSCFFFF